MIKAIINILNAIAERIRPCKHEWEQIGNVRVYYKSEPIGTKWTYLCQGCGKHKIINNG